MYPLAAWSAMALRTLEAGAEPHPTLESCQRLGAGQWRAGAGGGRSPGEEAWAGVGAELEELELGGAMGHGGGGGKAGIHEITGC